MAQLLLWVSALKVQLAKFSYVMLARLPRLLPSTPEALDALVHRVSVLNGYPSDDSARTAVATAILHLPMDKGSAVNTRASDAYFAHLMFRSVVNQVAFGVVDAKRAAKMTNNVNASAATDEKAV